MKRTTGIFGSRKGIRPVLALLVLAFLITRFFRGWPMMAPAPDGVGAKVIETRWELPGAGALWQSPTKKI